MAPLPEFRLTPGKPAFSCTEVDYMGPLAVKLGRSTLNVMFVFLLAWLLEPSI